MNIGDRLRAEVSELVSRESRSLDDDYRRLMDAYQRRTADPRSFLSVEDKAEGPLLGVAAYTLGVHYSTRDKTEQAEYWLEIAAGYDIGDAALRLAHLCEVQSVTKFNMTAALESSAPVDDPKLILANDWYDRAREAGYTRGEEQPSLDLDLDDCCPSISELQAREWATQIIADAETRAAAMVRQARADVKLVIDDARQEVANLAQQRQLMTERLFQLRTTLQGLAGLVGQPRKAAGFRKRFLGVFGKRSEEGLDFPIPHELENDLAYCAQVMIGLPMPDEPISRPMLATMIKEVAEPKPVQADESEIRRRSRTRSSFDPRRVRPASA